MRSVIPEVLLLAAVLTTGCAATVAADGYGPDLVYVSPGVQVIADYNEPIFYSDGFYWRFDGGTWYRSTYYTGGWVYARPPVAVMRIDRPYAYRYYRPAGWAGHPRQAPPGAASGWRGNQRSAPPPAASGWRGNQPPAAAPPASGWRGTQPPAAARRPPPSYGPQPGRPAPSSGQGQHGGWRGNHR